MDKQRVKQFLVDLGFEGVEAQIYFSLLSKGISTPLEISRDTRIDRAKVYRRLEDMTTRGLVSEVVDEKRKMYEAVGVDKLEDLLVEKKKGLEGLEKSFSEVKAYLTANVGLNEPETKVLFYRGKDGLKQMVWNNLRAKKEIVGYTYRQITEFVGLKFTDRWSEEFKKRGLYFRHVYSDHYKESTKALREKSDYSDKHFESKYISREKLDIDHQIDIYNDVVAYYNWHEGEVFGVEIYNKKVAKMQKQLFEIVWKMGK